MRVYVCRSGFSVYSVVGVSVCVFMFARRFAGRFHKPINTMEAIHVTLEGKKRCFLIRLLSSHTGRVFDFESLAVPIVGPFVSLPIVSTSQQRNGSGAPDFYRHNWCHLSLDAADAAAEHTWDSALALIGYAMWQRLPISLAEEITFIMLVFWLIGWGNCWQALISRPEACSPQRNTTRKSIIIDPSFPWHDRPC